MALLEVESLTVDFYTDAGVVRAVDGLSYRLERGETFGIVGESGAGKTVASLALLGLVGDGEIVDGTIRFDGRELLSCSPSELRAIRGNRLSMSFQNAAATFNPVYTVGEQIAETIRAHEAVSRRTARERTLDLLERVEIAAPASRYADYPHEFSGGMLQRAAVAMALACDPDLLILDEPTTGLDVTVQAQLLELLETLARDDEMAIQLVTHDLGVVAACCDRALVLYAGDAVERAPVEELFYDPKHPYTAGLMASIPRIGDGRDRLPPIPGSMPDPVDRPTGCRFHPRCPYAEAVCATRDPPLLEADTGRPVTDVASGGSDVHVAACHEYAGDLDGGLEYEVRIVGEEEETGGDRR
ncbi:ABC transporter ATP-binding protein [Natrarchaeobaculum sulfurireducens]|uniref:Oligopeptide transport system permease protein OppB n=1 Tax=Natrarchaeobaculum sulfurireducens TaxID=2044521 RepID=A0A346PND1_9EURY|nr:ABC transporter ATP-binding protein [Natrarchaeobaculum sulfurireducens]AXR81026.1 Oligopeptide transport system permease protein OppB [Natrarchaeobaculum sulfurireducens]